MASLPPTRMTRRTSSQKREAVGATGVSAVNSAAPTDMDVDVAPTAGKRTRTPTSHGPVIIEAKPAAAPSKPKKAKSEVVTMGATMDVDRSAARVRQWPALSSSDPPVDVIIIGGGLAGFSAADRLKRAGKTFLILEARPEPGGRASLTANEERGFHDFGASYVGGTPQAFLQSYVNLFRTQAFDNTPLSLLSPGPAPTLATYRNPSNKWLFQLEAPSSNVGGANDAPARPKVLQLPCDNPYLLPGSVMEVGQVLGVLNAMCLTVKPFITRPWEAVSLMPLDYITAEQLVMQILGSLQIDPNSPSVANLKLAVWSAYAAELRDMSALGFLLVAATAGSFTMLFDLTGNPYQDADGSRFTYGARSFVHAFATLLDDEKGNTPIRCNTRVVKIKHSPAGVTVTTDRKVTISAQRVIIAMPPPLAQRIRYEPALPAIRESLAAAMVPGAKVKAFVSFKTPFWRQLNLSGKSSSTDANRAPWSWIQDYSWEPVNPYDYDHEQGRPTESTSALVAFMGGDTARAWQARSKTERQAKMLEQLRTYYGPKVDDEVLPDGYSEWDMSQLDLEMGMNVPSYHLPPGALTQFGAALRTPVDSIHWAGTETATNWCGYMEGALQSGARAANEVLMSLPDTKAKPAGASSVKPMRL